MSLRSKPIKQEAADTSKVPLDQLYLSTSASGADEPKSKRRKRVNWRMRFARIAVSVPLTQILEFVDPGPAKGTEFDSFNISHVPVDTYNVETTHHH